MGTSKIVSGGAALVLTLAIPTAVYEVYANNVTQRAADTARQQNDELLARLRTVQERAAADSLQISREVATLAAATNAAQERDAAERKMQGALAKQRIVSQNAAKAAQAESQAANNAFMARHPEARAADIESKRAVAGGTFMPLFKSLRLTPEQIDQFKKLYVEQSGTGAIVGEARQQMRALLGEDGYRQYEEFTSKRATIPWQKTIEIAGNLFDTASPLAAAQAEQLFRILTENRTVPTWTKEPQFDWSAIIPQAKEVLSEAQLTMVERYRTEDELAQGMARARAEWPRTSIGGSTPSGK